MDKIKTLVCGALLAGSVNVNSSEKIDVVINDVSCEVWETLVLYHYNRSNKRPEYRCMDPEKLPVVDYVCLEGEARVIFEDPDYNVEGELNSLFSCVTIDTGGNEKKVIEQPREEKVIEKQNDTSREERLFNIYSKKFRDDIGIDISDEELSIFINQMNLKSEINKGDQKALVSRMKGVVETEAIKKIILHFSKDKYDYEYKMNEIHLKINQGYFFNGNLGELLTSVK